jgi:hypothetical protein
MRLRSWMGLLRKVLRARKIDLASDKMSVFGEDIISQSTLASITSQTCSMLADKM